MFTSKSRMILIPFMVMTCLVWTSKNVICTTEEGSIYPTVDPVPDSLLPPIEKIDTKPSKPVVQVVSWDEMKERVISSTRQQQNQGELPVPIPKPVLNHSSDDNTVVHYPGTSTTTTTTMPSLTHPNQLPNSNTPRDFVSTVTKPSTSGINSSHDSNNLNDNMNIPESIPGEQQKRRHRINLERAARKTANGLRHMSKFTETIPERMEVLVGGIPESIPGERQKISHRKNLERAARKTANGLNHMSQFTETIPDRMEGLIEKSSSIGAHKLKELGETRNSIRLIKLSETFAQLPEKAAPYIKGRSSKSSSVQQK